MGMNGWDDAKKHPFLESVEWLSMLKMAGPFFPLYEMRLNRKNPNFNADNEYFPKNIADDPEMAAIMNHMKKLVSPQFYLPCRARVATTTRTFNTYRTRR